MRWKKALRLIHEDFSDFALHPYRKLKKSFREEEKKEDMPVFDMQGKPEKEKNLIGDVFRKSGVAGVFKFFVHDRGRFEKLLGVIIISLTVVMFLNIWNGWKFIAVSHSIYFTDIMVPAKVNAFLEIFGLFLVSAWFFFGMIPMVKQLGEQKRYSAEFVTRTFCFVGIFIGILFGSYVGQTLLGQPITILNDARGWMQWEIFVTEPASPFNYSLYYFFGLVRGAPGYIMDDALMVVIIPFLIVYGILQFGLKEERKIAIMAISPLSIMYATALSVYIGAINAIVILVASAVISSLILVFMAITVVPFFRFINRIAGKQIENTLLLFWPAIALIFTTVVYIIIAPLRILLLILAFLWKCVKRTVKRPLEFLWKHIKATAKKPAVVSFMRAPYDLVLFIIKKFKK